MNIKIIPPSPFKIMKSFHLYSDCVSCPLGFSLKFAHIFEAHEFQQQVSYICSSQLTTNLEMHHIDFAAMSHQIIFTALLFFPSLPVSSSCSLAGHLVLNSADDLNLNQQGLKLVEKDKTLSGYMYFRSRLSIE